MTGPLAAAPPHVVTVNAAGRHRQQCHGTSWHMHDRETATPVRTQLARRPSPQVKPRMETAVLAWHPAEGPETSSRVTGGAVAIYKTLKKLGWR